MILKVMVCFFKNDYYLKVDVYGIVIMYFYLFIFLIERKYKEKIFYSLFFLINYDNIVFLFISGFYK